MKYLNERERADLELCNQAKAPPWHYRGHDDQGRLVVVDGKHGFPICRLFGVMIGDKGKCEDNGKLIARSPEALLEHLETINALREKLDLIKKSIDDETINTAASPAVEGLLETIREIVSDEPITVKYLVTVIVRHGRRQSRSIHKLFVKDKADVFNQIKEMYKDVCIESIEGLP